MHCRDHIANLFVKVGILFFCDTLNSAFDVSFVYIPLVAKYGKKLTRMTVDYELTMLTGDVDALNYATWGKFGYHMFD